MPQERNTAGGNPLGDVNVTRRIKTGVMRMDEATRLPTCGLKTHLKTIEDLLGPLGIVTQMNENLIVLVENRDSCMQVRDEQVRAARIEMRRETEDVVDEFIRLGLSI
jgi:hypothetical protein